MPSEKFNNTAHLSANVNTNDFESVNEQMNLNNGINMFDQNKKCLDLRRSSNFNSYKNSEVMNSRVFHESKLEES